MKLFLTKIFAFVLVEDSIIPAQPQPEALVFLILEIIFFSIIILFELKPKEIPVAKPAPLVAPELVSDCIVLFEIKKFEFGVFGVKLIPTGPLLAVPVNDNP